MSSQDEMNVEAVTGQAADWISTALSVPMIWPKATALVSIGVTALGIGLVAAQLVKPAVPPAPPLDQRRVAEIRTQVDQAAAALRTQLESASVSSSTEVKDFSDPIFDPKHGEKHHETTRIHAD